MRTCACCRNSRHWTTPFDSFSWLFFINMKSKIAFSLWLIPPLHFRTTQINTQGRKEGSQRIMISMKSLTLLLILLLVTGSWFSTADLHQGTSLFICTKFTVLSTTQGLAPAESMLGFNLIESYQDRVPTEPGGSTVASAPLWGTSFVIFATFFLFHSYDY